MREQQPTRESLFDRMIRVANAGLYGAEKREIHIAQQKAANAGADLHHRHEFDPADLEGLAANLNHALQRRFIILQNHGNRSRSFGSKQPGFDGFAAPPGSGNRNEAGLNKVHALPWHAANMEHLPGTQWNTRQQSRNSMEVLWLKRL